MLIFREIVFKRGVVRVMKVYICVVYFTLITLTRPYPTKPNKKNSRNSPKFDYVIDASYIWAPNAWPGRRGSVAWHR